MCRGYFETLYCVPMSVLISGSGFGWTRLSGGGLRVPKSNVFGMLYDIIPYAYGHDDVWQ